MYSNCRKCGAGFERTAWQSEEGLCSFEPAYCVLDFDYWVRKQEPRGSRAEAINEWLYLGGPEIPNKPGQETLDLAAKNN